VLGELRCQVLLVAIAIAQAHAFGSYNGTRIVARSPPIALVPSAMSPP
jgi:hypothetical protein